MDSPKVRFWYSNLDVSHLLGGALRKNRERMTAKLMQCVIEWAADVSFLWSLWQNMWKIHHNYPNAEWLSQAFTVWGLFWSITFWYVWPVSWAEMKQEIVCVWHLRVDEEIRAGTNSICFTGYMQKHFYYASKSSLLSYGKQHLGIF